MSTAREIEYRGKKVKITVAKSGGAYVGTFGIEATDPPVRGVGADSNREDGAFDSAERKAKETIDQHG